jgi:hypothetical protein
LEHTCCELLNNQQRDDMEVLFVLTENRFDLFKDFLDFLELKLIFFDDLDNFQDLGIENLFS